MKGYILFGRSGLRHELLTLFFTRPGLKAHGRELARQLGHGVSATARELARLEAAGVLRSETVGRARVYRLDDRSPVVSELRPVVQRTVGAEALLREAFAGMQGIEEAFIFGSYGTSRETPRSDIDLFVVGRPSEQMWKRVVEVERKLGRDVNLKHYTRAEVDRLRRTRSEFIRSAYRTRRVALVEPEGIDAE